VKGSKAKLAGWILSVLVAALLAMSATFKFIEWEGKEEAFKKSHFTVDQMTKIGVVEVACTVLYLIPQTAFLGAILLTGYLGGATVTHVQGNEPFIMPVIVGIVAWIALGLRNSEIFRLAFGGRTATPPG
jgi:hypothetical protein